MLISRTGQKYLRLFNCNFSSFFNFEENHIVKATVTNDKRVAGNRDREAQRPFLLLLLQRSVFQTRSFAVGDGGGVPVFVRSECDVLVCDDSSPIDVSEDNPVTCSNPLFDYNEDFTSSDDESLSEEDVLKETFKIYSNPLFEFDDDFTSSDVNPLFNEVLEDVESEDSFDSKLAEPTLLISPLSNANKDECFDPGGDEIDAFLDLDISTEIENNFHNSKGDIIFLEKLLIKNTFPNLPSEVFFDHDPRSLKDEPDNDDLMTEDKVFDPGIHEKSFSLTFVKLTFEDRHYFPITFVIRIFLPYLTYSMDSPFLPSSGSEDTIFDPGISAFHFSSLKPVAYENPMVIFPFFYFCPKEKGIRGESS
ncbi:hypothetical protein Tco_1161978 [Tanacetum coccineum]